MDTIFSRAFLRNLVGHGCPECGSSDAFRIFQAQVYDAPVEFDETGDLVGPDFTPAFETDYSLQCDNCGWLIDAPRPRVTG